MVARITKLIGLLLALGFSMTAFSQFNQKNIFPADTSVYTIVVPAGASVTTRAGKTFKGGETVAIPAKYVTVVEPAEVTPVVNRYGQHFMNKNEYQTLAPEQQREYTVLSVQIPEGASVTRADGEVEKGPTTILLMVKPASMAGHKMKETPSDFMAPSDVPGYQH